MRTWIKLYTEILHDPKMHGLTDKQFRACINLFALAGYVDKDGVVGTFDDIRFHLRTSRRDTESIIKRLESVAVLTFDEPNYTVAAFSKRNCIAPSQSNEKILQRVHAYRARKQAESESRNEDVTPLQSECNESVTTLEKRREEKRREEENNNGAKKNRARDYHFENLATICRLNPPDNEWSKMPKSASGQVNKFVKELKDIGATEDQIVSFGEWWNQNDWRGQQGQPPKPADVVKNWALFQNGVKPNGNGRTTHAADGDTSSPMMRAILAAKKDPNYGKQ